MVPRHKSETFSPLLPSLRYSMKSPATGFLERAPNHAASPRKAQTRQPQIQTHERRRAK
jgi:hypothetical protein